MENEIDFKVSVTFKGSRQEFEKVAPDIAKLKSHKSIMIDTVPLPEKPAIQLEEVSIGTWPTPEIVIKPRPPKPLPGIWPVTRLVNQRVQSKLIEGMPRVKIDGINGGMRNPHLHLKDEVVLLDNARFKEFVGHIAKQLSNELLKK